jgi:hypothetical protein
MARFGEIKQFLPNKSPWIENESPQIESVLSVKSRLLSVELKIMVTLLQILAICATKTGLFGKNSVDRKIRWVYVRVRQKNNSQ